MYYSQLRQGASEAFRAAIRLDQEDLRQRLESERVPTFSVFHCDPFLCVYLESEETYEWDWPTVYGEWLERWPGQDKPALSVPMLDIYHDGVPTDAASWRDGRHVERRIGSIARLEPDMAASYIFYHYQLQEEKPESFNKTYIIGAHGPFLFSYHELPATVCESKKQGLLSTNHSPAGQDWHVVMRPHFRTWENVSENEVIWKQMEQLL
jgi:hypothetical protein